MTGPEDPHQGAPPRKGKTVLPPGGLRPGGDPPVVPSRRTHPEPTPSCAVPLPDADDSFSLASPWNEQTANAGPGPSPSALGAPVDCEGTERLWRAHPSWTRRGC